MELNKIYHGDCLDIMPTIPDKSIDMVLCDLPYGVTANKWDSIIPLDKLWKEYERICKDNCAIVLHCQQPFTSNLVSSNYKWFRHSYSWLKNIKTNFLQAKKMPMRGFEDIVVFGIKSPNYYPIMRPTKWNTTGGKTKSETYSTERRTQTKRNGFCLPDNVLDFKCIHGSEKRYHPTEKPIALIEHLIHTYTKRDEVVLDNCAGSCTTAVACNNTSRKYICIEKEEKYYQIAEQRLNGNLF